jgi:hypothetical protein
VSDLLLRFELLVLRLTEALCALLLLLGILCGVGKAEPLGTFL